jgi:hypothetical protein
MPMRSSGKAIGQSVGRMIFAGQDAKKIESNLTRKVGGVRLQAALSKRGVSGVAAKDIAEAMTGKQRGRAGWSQGKLKSVVEALQEVGVAHSEKSASHMVLQAAKNIEPAEVIAPHMSENQLKARIQETSRERRAEANAEEASDEHMGVMDRARGSMGRANAAGLAAELSGPAGAKANDQSVREVREQLRQTIKLQPKIRITKPNNPFSDQSGFQA